MSDSHFIDEKLAEFRRKHPLSDGWLIYRIAPHASSVSHALLPAFLRSHAPGAVVREEVSPSIDWDSGKSGRRQSLLTPPLHRRGAGIDEETWVGEIDFVWKNTPVHYQRFSLVMRFGEEPSTLIATKDRDALEDLWRELKAFERRFNSRTSCIYIFQEGPIPRPKLGWDDVVLPTGRIEEIRDSVRSFLKAKPLYKELNLPFRRGFLFSGPPGCGKTLTAKIIAANTKVGIFLLPLKSDIDDSTLARGTATDSPWPMSRKPRSRPFCTASTKAGRRATRTLQTASPSSGPSSTRTSRRTAASSPWPRSASRSPGATATGRRTSPRASRRRHEDRGPPVHFRLVQPEEPRAGQPR